MNKYGHRLDEGDNVYIIVEMSLSVKIVHLVHKV